MRSASSQAKYLGLMSALLFGSATAGPVINDWTISSNGGHDALTLQWSEQGTVEVRQFEAAQQVIFTLPDARLANGKVARVDVASSRILDAARLQEVTLPNGEKAVQLTVDLGRWTRVQATPAAQGLHVSFDVPQDFSKPDDGVSITMDDVDAMLRDSYGAANAPATGAGQGDGGEAFAGFYQPPTAEAAPSMGDSARPMDIYSLDVERKLDERIRQVDFKDAPLLTVLRVIAEKGDLNILVNPNQASGKVSLKLRNVTFRHMLEALLKANNLGYKVEEGGILRIVPRNQVKSTEKETITKAIPINWVNASDLRDALEEFVDDDDGVLEIAEASNSIIIRDVPENVQMVEDIIARVDIAEKQVLMEVRLVDMTETASRALGFRTGAQRENIDSRFLAGTGTNTGTTGFTSTATDSFNNTLNSTLTDTFTNTIGGGISGNVSNNMSQASNIASSMTNAATSSLSDSFSDTFRRLPETALAAGSLPTAASALTLTHLADVTLFGNEYLLDFEIRAQEDRGEAVVLANPTVLSLNNQTAIVEIQRREPYVSAVNSDQGSVATIAFEEIGTRVEIQPRITNNGYVQMQIKPEQRILRGFRDVFSQGGVQSVPLVDERNVVTSVIVKDEQTVALGGLRQFESTSSETGVPYLLRLPVLSWLFKSQTNSTNKTDLYLFVTPHIVKNPELSAYEMAVYEKIDYNWDLPDYYYDEVLPRVPPGTEKDPRVKR